MTVPDLRPPSVPAAPPDPRISAISRRVSASGSLAIVFADLAFGTRQRDHAEVLHFTTHARVVDAMGARL